MGFSMRFVFGSVPVYSFFLISSQIILVGEGSGRNGAEIEMGIMNRGVFVYS